MAVMAIGALAAYAVPTGYASLAYAVATSVATMALQEKTVVNQEGARLTDLKVQTSAYGNPVPILAGTNRVSGNMIWATDIKETPHYSSTRTGKGGGGSTVNNTTYSYSVNLAILIGEGVIPHLRKMFINNELFFDFSFENEKSVGDFPGEFKFYSGSEEQLPDPTIEMYEGVGNVEAYRGYSYIVLSDFNLDKWGGNIPSNISFEVTATDEEVEKELKIIQQNIDLKINTSLNGAKYNQVNNSIFAISQNNLLKIDVGSGDVENSRNYSLHNKTFYSSRLDFTESGDVVLAGRGFVDNRDQEAVFVVDADKLSIKNSYPKSSFEKNKKIEDFASRLPVRHFKIDKNYIGINYVDRDLERNSQRDKITFYIYDTNFKPQDVEFISFTKRNTVLNTNQYYAARQTSLSSSASEANSKCLFDVDKQTNNFYFVVYQNKQTNSARDKRRLIALNRIDLRTKAHYEEFVDLLADESDANLIIKEIFFDNEKRNLFVLYNDSLLGDILISFNVDTKEKTSRLISEFGSSSGTLLNFEFSSKERKLFAIKPSTIIDYYNFIEVNIDDYSVNSYDKEAQDLKAPSFHRSYNFVNDYAGLIYLKDNGNGSAVLVKNLRERIKEKGYNLARFIRKLLLKTNLQETDFDIKELENIEIPGYIIATTTAIRGCLEQLGTAFSFDVVETDFVLKFRKEERSVSRHINYNDLSATNYAKEINFSSNVVITCQQELELPQVLNITYIDKEKDYQQNTQDASRYAVETTQIKDVKLPVSLSADFAKNLASKLLAQAWTRRFSYSFETNYKYLDLEPGDVVTVETKDATLLMRIVFVEAGGSILKFKAVAEDNAIYKQNEKAATSKEYKKEIEVLSSTKTEFFDMPIFRNYDDNAGFYVSATASSNSFKWTGSSLFITNDENEGNFYNIENFYIKAQVGSTLNKLGDFKKGFVVDYNNHIDVKVNTVEILSTNEIGFYNGANFAIVGNEYIYFKDVEQLDDKTYRLRTLLRGLFNTEKEISNHSESDTFVIVNENNLKRIYQESSSLNMKKYLKNVTFGKTLNETFTMEYTNSGKSVKCYSVSELNKNKDASGNYFFTWKPRARGVANLQDWTDIVDIDGDLYEIDFIDEYEQVVRTVTITNARSFVYSNNLKNADFENKSFKIVVYKKNMFGRGDGVELIV